MTKAQTAEEAFEAYHRAYEEGTLIQGQWHRHEGGDQAMSAAIQPPARIGFDWPGLDIHTLDEEFMDGEPAEADLEPFQKAWREGKGVENG